MRKRVLVGSCLSYGVAFKVHKVLESARVIWRIAAQPKILSITAKEKTRHELKRGAVVFDT